MNYYSYRMNKEKLDSFLQAMNRKMQAMPERIRLWTTEYSNLPRSILLSGLRGTGKSTFLLYHSKGKRLFYFSADNRLASDENLYDFCSFVFMQVFQGGILVYVIFAKD